ncbi:MAE_28990/MAE_18760 family HEPN-like nuclease [Micromonospora chalcea]|uniref:MAE_28990/MAE_18760 family HEPN-like nuclease n=1 Tax=Micromonospora chalcea TaxID=1874 RepID=UPI00340B7944
MSTKDLFSFFGERFAEIDEYLLLLGKIEEAAQAGAPRIAGVDARITIQQQRILYSSVYLQLYNLVEAVVSRCIEAVTKAATLDGKWRVDDLNGKLQAEWVRAVARTHETLNPTNRLKFAVDMCNHLMAQLPLLEFEINIGGGGNWDDTAIEKISDRVGCRLSISPGTMRLVKQVLRDDMGPLKLVKDRRNGLAHGSLSFVECADGLDVDELKKMADAVKAYLRETIDCFARYIDLLEFLDPASKSKAAA